LRQDCIVEGLFANPITSEEKPALLSIPQCKGEHSAKALKAIGPSLSIKGENYFCVGLRTKACAVGLAFLAKLLEIVDLTVEDDAIASLRIEHRLAPKGAEVDDAQTTMTEGARVVLR
jgi:hypothetical protein